ncbi:hypothetical protein MNEG_3140 [Monoraphidium neglectum]|uniref:Uncharacterized protein n=1 Tax=Monoraphidium neglectum TaxID=145388 RepID=A0A0D2NIR8_9CHLO|nr:hypothetical protein MNEG_3140 [Monoraphidium neglectum]KIZ04816.1 hypothetical protein MNEG_3140 [Monoraphidium neglectum]|eukprot:XP_013903835.1 hypothetical protein MNEG_3140 [Monoraphidium neglectum]
MTKALVATVLLALMVSAAVATPLTKAEGRRLMQRGGGIDGGIQTQDILSENDAAAGIQQAVSSGNAYQATEDGFRDAYGATL